MLIIIVLVFFLTVCFFIVPPYSKYSESKYKEVSGNTFFQTIRCTLKKMNVTSPNVKVIKRKSLLRSIKKDIETSLNIMTREEVDQLYSKLRKYTLVDNQVKKAHVDNVRMKRL
ncbi:hypothetical protein [Bacillus litorisediminis]|uniref:hypothetical protein n=1 Tax=Bacillus litorisediminis TaxID=2922713 RepID=UPI001FAD7AAE|nr:hypothetical protein [Bacillus litorisediminis]